MSLDKKELEELLTIFKNKWNESTSLWKNEYFEKIENGYKDFDIKASFGNGIRIKEPKYPWIAFLKYGQRVSNGIYVSFAYNHKKDTFKIGINFSRDNIPDIDNDVIERLEKERKNKEFSINSIDELIDALDENIEIFNNILEPIFNSSNKEKLRMTKIKNIILYGSPGVGKTHNIKKLISLIEEKKSEKEIFEIIKNNKQNNGVDIDNIKDRIKFITFHQSFGYEDFIEGFRPNENGDIKLQDGIFKSICNDANNDRDNNYYLVIDEINRGNISKIFGELITLIEEDKRDTLEVTLPYSKKLFKIPSNLYIIGTMNSTDKSIALIDIALRRRFTFLKMEPKSSLVKNKKAKEIMEQLNDEITKTLGVDYVLGHSYFMKIENNDDDLDFVLEYKIKPLLEEYFYGDMDGYNQVKKIIEDIFRA